MRKLFSIVLISMFVVAFAAPVFAGISTDKLSEGFKKAVTSPTNVYESVQEEYEAAEFKPFGALGGLVKGICLMGVDFVTGTFDVLTFPVDVSDLISGQ